METEQHIERHGCVAPYLGVYDPKFPVCSKKKDLVAWSKGIKGLLYGPPCQTMPKIDFTISHVPSKVEGKFMIWLHYPKRVKMVKQSQAVDVHSLIGNIGGYIGLFLGMINF